MWCSSLVWKRLSPPAPGTARLAGGRARGDELRRMDRDWVSLNRAGWFWKLISRYQCSVRCCVALLTPRVEQGRLLDGVAVLRSLHYFCLEAVSQLFFFFFSFFSSFISDREIVDR